MGMRKPRTVNLCARLRDTPGAGTIFWLSINNTPSAAKEFNMGLILWLIVGGIVGWLASMIMKTDGQQGILLNIVVGIIGAFVGGWLISPLVGAGTINSGFSIASVLVSLVGAVILLAIVNLFRRGRVR